MADKIEKYIKSVLPEPDKRDFDELFHIATPEAGFGNRDESKSHKVSAYDSKSASRHSVEPETKER